MKYIIVTLLLVLSYSCDINNQKLLLINNTNDPIYVRLSIDTTPSKDAYLYKVLSHDSIWPNFVMGGEGAWEYKINSDSKDSTLHVFIFSTNILTESMIKDRNFKRLDFKIGELDSLNWKLVYK